MVRVSSVRKMPTAGFGVFLVALGLCVGTLLAPMRYGLWWDVLCSCGSFIAVIVGLLTTVKACAPNLSTTLLRIVCVALIVSYVGWYFLKILRRQFLSDRTTTHTAKI
jgi:Na+/pantothenate symporter